MRIPLSRPWHAEFPSDVLPVLQHAIPSAIYASQARSAAAHAAWGDPDGDRHVYGAGMSVGTTKELASRLSALPGFRQQPIPGTPRKLMMLGDVLLHPLRVGLKMPRRNTHIRIPKLAESSRAIFRHTGMKRYDPPTLDFEVEAKEDEEDVATAAEVLAHLSGIKPDSLIVTYYSSSPHGVGSIMWGPAKLKGNYLDFTEPETLTYRVDPEVTTSQVAASNERQQAVVGGRPRTPAKLRADRKSPTE